MKISVKSWLPVQMFVPRYDELSLFLMSLSFCLVCFLNPELKAIAIKLLITDFDWHLYPIYALILLFLSGMILSVFHALSGVRMTPGQRTSMLFFAVMANLFSGLVAGACLLASTFGILAVFPLWNILNAVLLLLLCRIGIVNEQAVSDDAPSKIELLVGTLAVCVTFSVCQFVFDLNWAITFSICMSYASGLSRLAGRFLPQRLRPR